MRNVFTIFSKEMKSYFASPLGYLVVASFFFVSTLMFYGFIGSDTWRERGAVEMMRLVLMNTCFILLLVVPALTMRLFSEERRTGTIEMLMTCPVKDVEVVLGKFLAAMGLLFVMISMTLIHALILEWCGSPHWPTLLSGYLGLFLLGSAFTSMGILTSSLTKNQVLAAIFCFVSMLMLWIMDWLGEGASKPMIKDILKGLSILQPFDDFVKGVIDVRHLVYYGSFVFFCLYLTVKSVEAKKWR